MGRVVGLAEHRGKVDQRILKRYKAYVRKHVDPWSPLGLINMDKDHEAAEALCRWVRYEMARALKRLRAQKKRGGD
jgi:hypothetical protein